MKSPGVAVLLVLITVAGVKAGDYFNFQLNLAYCGFFHIGSDIINYKDL